MQETMPNFSPEFNLNDRDPAFDFNGTTAAQVHNSREDYKKMVETMEKYQTLKRRDRRKIVKPSFSDVTRKALRK